MQIKYRLIGEMAKGFDQLQIYCNTSSFPPFQYPMYMTLMAECEPGEGYISGVCGGERCLGVGNFVADCSNSNKPQACGDAIKGRRPVQIKTWEENVSGLAHAFQVKYVTV